MRKLFLALAGAAALGIASGAQGAVTVITPGDVFIGPCGPATCDGNTLVAGESVTFLVSGDIFNGPISATFSHNGIPLGAFTDLFQFTIPVSQMPGLGSGSLTTGVNLLGFGGSTDLDILSVTINGMLANLTLQDANGNICFVRGVGTCGANETWSVNDVPITPGVLNTIDVTGNSRGQGSYGGNATFVPIPEPATWAMMLLGFAAVGYSMRRRRRPELAQLA